MIILPDMKAMAAEKVFTEAGIKSLIIKIKKAVAEVPTTAETEEDQETIRSAAAKIATFKNDVERTGKSLTADWKARAKVIDTLKGVAWEELEALQHKVRKPLTEREAAEKERQTEHAAKLADLHALINFQGDIGVPISAAEIKQRLDQLPIIMQRDWQEFAPQADEAADMVRDTIKTKLEERSKYEKDQAELESRRAADKATDDAAQDQRDADARKLREDKIAKDAADNAATAERTRIANEQKAEKDAAEKREKDKKHRATVNNAAKAALMEIVGLTDKQATAVVIAIAKGEITNTKIIY